MYQLFSSSFTIDSMLEWDSYDGIFCQVRRVTAEQWLPTAGDKVRQISGCRFVAKQKMAPSNQHRYGDPVQLYRYQCGSLDILPFGPL